MSNWRSNMLFQPSGRHIRNEAYFNVPVSLEPHRNTSWSQKISSWFRATWNTVFPPAEFSSQSRPPSLLSSLSGIKPVSALKEIPEIGVKRPPTTSYVYQQPKRPKCVKVHIGLQTEEPELVSKDSQQKPVEATKKTSEVQTSLPESKLVKQQTWHKVSVPVEELPFYKRQAKSKAFTQDTKTELKIQKLYEKCFPEYTYASKDEEPEIQESCAEMETKNTEDEPNASNQEYESDDSFLPSPEPSPTPKKASLLKEIANQSPLMTEAKVPQGWGESKTQSPCESPNFGSLAKGNLKSLASIPPKLVVQEPQNLFSEVPKKLLEAKSKEFVTPFQDIEHFNQTPSEDKKEIIEPLNQKTTEKEPTGFMNQQTTEKEPTGFDTQQTTEKESTGFGQQTTEKKEPIGFMTQQATEKKEPTGFMTQQTTEKEPTGFMTQQTTEKKEPTGFATQQTTEKEPIGFMTQQTTEKEESSGNPFLNPAKAQSSPGFVFGSPMPSNGMQVDKSKQSPFAFGQNNSVFGNTGSGFAQPNSSKETTPLFGSTQPSPFGQNSSQPFVFRQNTSESTGFSKSEPFAFGQNKPETAGFTFGQSTSQGFGQTSGFSTPQGFGQSASGFPQTTPEFSTPQSFGQTSGFAQTPLFGKTESPGFGQNTSPGFGQTTPSVFGSNSIFGSASEPQTPSSGFGSSFGNQGLSTPPAFGSQPIFGSGGSQESSGGFNIGKINTQRKTVRAKRPK